MRNRVRKEKGNQKMPRCSHVEANGVGGQILLIENMDVKQDEDW